MNGWAGPAIGIFLISQLGAAVWWASDVDNQVNDNVIIPSSNLYNLVLSGNYQICFSS